MRNFSWLLCSCLILLSAGCKSSDEEDKPKAPEKPPVTRGAFRVQPSDGGTVANPHKPGHWGVASLQLTANQDDMRGELASRAASAEGVPLSVHDTGVGLVTRRPVVLPKGQEKVVRTQFWLPYRENPNERRPAIDNRLFFSGSEIVGGSGLDPVVDLQPQEYIFTILSRRTEEWQFLTAADWTEIPNDVDFSDNRIRWYRVLRPGPKDLEYLPDSLLTWTTTSAVLWDDLRPDQLTEGTQQAVRDWLNWGGKIIVNGPRAIDQLRGTSFEDLLPITNSKLAELPEGAFEELLANWSIKEDKTGEEVARKVRSLGAIAGLVGDPTKDAEPVQGTGELVYRKRVGRGMVVLTRFDLTSGWMNEWHSTSAFFSGPLLQLPPRTFDRSMMYFANNYRGMERSAGVTTNLRLFSRDAAAQQKVTTGDEQFAGWNVGTGNSLGEWSGNNAAIIAAANHLRGASGINIPSRTFVLRSMAWYLAVLIPANFLICWVIGRIEWAWAFAPMIALVGAGWVTRSAQLDIGFARSLNELDVLELQPNYARGHLTRVVALYNSLSTNYNFSSENDASIVGPVPASQGTEARRQAQSAIDLKYGFGDGLEATGINVPSNRTSLYRVEQMADLPGGLRVEGDEVVNETQLDLEDVTVWRNDQGNVEVAVIGALSGQGRAKLRYIAQDDFKGWAESELGMEDFLTTIIRMGALAPNSVRLVGRTKLMPGLNMTPITNQQTGQTAVVAHLQYGKLRVPERDLMLRPKKQKNEFDTEPFPDQPAQGTN